MAAGLVQITNNLPGVEELVVDNSIGICVSPNSPREISRAVWEYYENRDLLADAGLRAKGMIEGGLNYECEFEKIFEFFHHELEIESSM